MTLRKILAPIQSTMWSSLGVFLLLCGLNSARPPIVDGPKDPPIIDPADLKKENGSEEWNKAIEYTRYLQEVVQGCLKPPNSEKLISHNLITIDFFDVMRFL